VIEIARAGAGIVYGIEISERYLRQARQRVDSSQVADRCRLITNSDCEPVDIVFSIDAFEHFEKPGEILAQMHSLLKPGGKLYVSFGPTWYHPLGGHAFSPFPWAHIVCSEKALVRWRNLYFPGTSVTINGSGLNRMTVKRFLALCRRSGFAIEKQEIVPIRKLKFLHNPLTREFTTAVVRVILRK
jgi:SAM-dependent methyltransferase